MKEKLNELRNRLEKLEQRKEGPLLSVQTMLQSATDYMDMSVAPYLQNELNLLILQTLILAEFFIKYAEEENP